MNCSLGQGLMSSAGPDWAKTGEATNRNATIKQSREIDLPRMGGKYRRKRGTGEMSASYGSGRSLNSKGTTRNLASVGTSQINLAGSAVASWVGVGLKVKR